MGLKRTLELGELDATIRMIEASKAHGRENRGGCSPLGAVLPGVLAGIPGMLDFLRRERRDALEVCLLEQHTLWCLDRWLGWFQDEAGPLSDDSRDWVHTCVVRAVNGDCSRLEVLWWYRKARGKIPPRSRGSGFLDVLKSALDSLVPSTPREVQGSLFA